MMNILLRTTFLALLFFLYLVNPGLFHKSTVSCSHASKIDYSAEESKKPDSLNENLFLSKIYAVQVAACRDETSARNILEKLKGRGYNPDIYSWEDSSDRLWYSIFLGVYEDVAEAGLVARRYRETEGKPVFIKTLDRRFIAAGETRESSPGESTDHRQAEAAVHGEEGGVPEESQDVRDKRPEMVEDEDSGAEFTFRGFIEFQSFFNTGTGQNFKDANKKNEIRNRLEIKYGTEDTFLFAVSNLYLFQTYLNKDAKKSYVYSKERGISRNLRFSSQEAELRFDEIYLNYGAENFRLRAGNQIYGWGTADAFNPTSYFNPYDLRELIFRDDDENKAGVPSISGMFFLGDYTLEAVFVPVHIPTIMAPDGNFWSFTINKGFPCPIVFDEPQELDADIGNCGYGARLSASSGGVDISVSGYHGPDKDPVFLPYKMVGVLPHIAILVKPQSYVVSMFGVDFSATLGDFVVQFEAVYSPDKMGIVDQSITSLASWPLPLKVERSRYISYATGFNYFIPLDRLIDGHEGESIFTFEWSQSRYLDSGLQPPSFTDIITCKFEDSYFDGRITTAIKGIFETQYGGKIFWPEIGYDFQNGLSLKLSYAGIWGEEGSTFENTSIFYYFQDNDIVMGTVRYEY